MVTMALPGLLMLAPVLGFDNPTLKDLLPEKGVALLMATEKLFAVVSPLAHCKVPLAAEKLVPDVAVPLAVAYPTLTAPFEPSIRWTVTIKLPAL